MISIIIVQSLIILALIATLIYVFVFKKEGEIDIDFSAIDRLEAQLKDEMMRSRLENNTGQKEIREELDKTLNANFSSITQVVEGRLNNLQKDNSEKLEKMRETVDEKLHATLERRFGESFKMVSDRLDQVHKGLGEMQTVAAGVGDLKKILSNVKTRGTWGEVQLGNLIEEIFTPDQYEKNVKTKKGSSDNVEYAIKLPGNSDDIKHIYLPIDAKFPLEDYQRLMEARENNEDLISFSKNLEMRIKAEAKDIKNKYIDTPYTTDFGLLFLPVESLYAEVLRIPGLFESVRREYNVIITGPTTVQAILNSLQMGFKTLSIQKRSSEVWEILGVVKKEFNNFGVILEKAHKKIQEAGNTIEQAMTRSRAIDRKLNKVTDTPLLGEKDDVIAVIEEVIEE
ncbi:DNA recombination protein RmuC [Candidatus Parcubacteria bacterium]|nr:DNA recombination protein RmuC [Candidatus Parcubacteria bacterium]